MKNSLSRHQRRKPAKLRVPKNLAGQTKREKTGETTHEKQQAFPKHPSRQTGTGKGEVALTIDEKHEIPKMGPKTLNFVEKSHEYAHENPSLVPNYLDMAEFDTDFADAHGLWTLSNRIRQLEEGISDTQMTAGSEAYQAALVFYNSAKIATSQGISGTQAVYEELKRRFPGGKHRTAEATEAS